MTLRPHVTSALEAELAAPGSRPKVLGLDAERVEDATFAAGSALLFMGMNTAVPVYGGVAAAVTVCELARARRPSTTPSTGSPQPVDNSHVLSAVDEEVRCRTLTLPLDDDASIPDQVAAVKSWNEWLPWEALRDGQEVPVPTSLPHPREVGFHETRLAKGVGQVRDWVRPMPDGSRLHAHEFTTKRDGSRGTTFEVHRDKLDPGRDPVTASIHWLSETDEGHVASVGLLALFGLFWAVKGAAIASALEG